MSYDMVIEQVKTLPEQLLASVSAFIKLLEAEQNEFAISQTKITNKESFFDLAGKIHLDRQSVSDFREASLI